MSARVLVVDDIPANVRLLEAKLSAEYFDVMTADSGAAALESIAANSPDIVLLDVMMPGMDGPATLKSLRTLPGLENTPVIFVTAKVQQAEVDYYLELGALEVISKPFDPMTLSSQLRQIWELRHAR